MPLLKKIISISDYSALNELPVSMHKCGIGETIFKNCGPHS
jgi:hypothetical protein